MQKRRARIGAVLLALAMITVGCVGDDGGDTAEASGGKGPRRKATGEFATDLPLTVDRDDKTVAAEFEVQPGTEEDTVTGAEPNQRLSLIDRKGNRLVVLKADKFGQAHFAYLPTELAEFQTGGRAKLPTSDGYVVEPGSGYTIRNDDTDPVQRSEPFEVLGRDDHPSSEFFDEQAKSLVPEGDETEMFGYVTTRDGVQLSVNVRLPGPADQGPYPTVVEYSGYAPSNPSATEPGSMIAGLFGYASVGVNMRGTGCSGGVFDVFNTAQQVDGYDAVEAIARQPWVKGNQVGMVGLSYAGITQLYVAATQPPSLAAVTPLSVIKDPWLQQWPGGVYNGGFTKRWLSERDSQSSAGGTSWVSDRIEGGDETCAAHQEIREQNIDFEAFGRSLERRPDHADARDLSLLVADIEVPVYLTGAWQDEQTGPQFADMLGNFDNAPVTKFTMFNGRHPDGYTPLVLTRWYEFLEFYVDQQVPRIPPGFRALAPVVFESFFNVPDLNFEPDRFEDFTDDQYDEALADYEAEPDVRVLFESGAGADFDGAPVPTFEASYDAWPPSDIEARSFHLDAQGVLADERAKAKGVDTFANDPAAGEVDFHGDGDSGLLAPTWGFDWTSYAQGDGLSYVTEPFEETTVLGGPGHVDLHMRVPDGDADVQASLSIIRADGTEWLITNGLLRLSDRKVDEKRSTELLIERTHAEEDAREMPKGRFEEARVAIPSFAQAFRPGDRLRLTISSPGRNHSAWAFETMGDDGTPRDVGRGPGKASRLVVGVLPGIDDVPDVNPPCPSLRGQACRPFEPVPNTEDS